MYETEANRQKETSDQIPAEIIARFGELNGTGMQRTVLPWSEHCTECVWPTCYTSCDLYSAREDGRCRRFVNGMVRIDCPVATNGYLLKISFKRWAKLWTPGNMRLQPAETALRVEHRDYRIASMLDLLPARIRPLASTKRYSIKKKLASRRGTATSKACSFVIECYNPEDRVVSLSFTIRSSATSITIPYQKLIELAPGFNRVRVPSAEIAAIVDLSRSFSVEIVPNSEGAVLTLFFGLLDFVHEDRKVEPARSGGVRVSRTKVKCVVWDLDNTLWEGTLMEDGPTKLTLKPGIREVLQTLDSRGILLSIASKNDHDEALAVLKKMEIDDLFLAPQISWQPKSKSIREIANRLNIGLNSLIFVDDSAFELEEVAVALPEVRIVDALDFKELADREDCHVPVTEESKNRRKLYRVEAERQDRASSFGGDYRAFLRDCEIRVKITELDDTNVERVYELTQRTNQMNFSGNRYHREVLGEIRATLWLDAWVVEVEDRFGSYGVVGFCIVDCREPIITDLMFSCRIHSKRVEHAVLGWLIRRYTDATGRDVWASYRRTPRNAPSGKVFEDVGMQEIASVDGISRLVFHRGQPVLDDGVITICAQSSPTAA
jgi:FkbH-like protein